MLQKETVAPPEVVYHETMLYAEREIERKVIHFQSQQRWRRRAPISRKIHHDEKGKKIEIKNIGDGADDHSCSFLTATFIKFFLHNL